MTFIALPGRWKQSFTAVWFEASLTAWGAVIQTLSCTLHAALVAVAWNLLTPEFIKGTAIKHIRNMPCHAGGLVDPGLAYLTIYRILYIVPYNTISA
ncbi:MAG: hypothetical protein M1351_01200 [Candidatus Thermoplasmatota archaeon]|nr:hypothetical protein [Candidatus Thermoplasmatota archaeon]